MKVSAEHRLPCLAYEASVLPHCLRINPRFGADGDDPFGAAFDGDDGRFPEHDALPLDINKGIGRSEVNTHVIGKKGEERIKHAVLLREESYHGHLRRVSSALSCKDDLGVAAVPGLVAGDQGVEEFLADLRIGDVLRQILAYNTSSCDCGLTFKEKNSTGKPGDIAYAYAAFYRISGHGYINCRRAYIYPGVGAWAYC